MKDFLKKLWGLAATLATLAGFNQTSFALPTLTVSPAVISNTYTGVITLNIAGLTNGEQVTVQKYLDLNGNGVIDGGEPLVDVFKITDGGASVINGVTNLNVPFDSNPTNGVITTSLNVIPALIMENLVGNFIYKVTSPTGNATAPLAVTNSTLAQTVRGVVYSNGVAPMPYAVVVAQDEIAENPAGGTVADATGHYSLAIAPGTYALIAAYPNFYFNQNAGPSFVLTNGMSLTNNLYLTNGTANISGNIYDLANSNAVGGLMLQLQQKSQGYFSVAFTDTNGNYSANVTPDYWVIQPEKQRLCRRAYVYPTATLQANATGGSATNVNLGLPKGTALYYGRITDNLNNPIANVEVDGSTTNNLYVSKGYSDTNGDYAVAVIGDQTNYWNCDATDSKNTILANYVVNFYGNLTFSSNQTTMENFAALPANATISGQVRDNSGNKIAGVGLNAYTFLSGNNYQSIDTVTDTNGNYSLAVSSGTWNVYFFTGGFSDSLDGAGYVDLTSPHYASIPPTNAILNLTVYPLGTPAISQPQRISSTQFSFNVIGSSNVNYTVQVATNLASTNWTSLFSFELTNSPFPVVDNHATNSPRFYRVQKN